METTLPVVVKASFTDCHQFHVSGALLLFIVCAIMVVKSLERHINRRPSALTEANGSWHLSVSFAGCFDCFDQILSQLFKSSASTCDI